MVTAGEVAGSPLPAAFRLELGLRRPEAPARVWLVGPTAGQREGLELDRDRRNARWLIDRGASGGGQVALPRWFFPEQPLPFAADLLHLLGRSAMAGYALVVASVLAGHLVRRTTPMRLRVTRLPRLEPRLVADLLLAGWLVAAALVSVRLYHQLPHILDAVSYTFQAGLLSGGRFWLPVPPAVDAFRGPFEVLWQGRWFSQYPPGAPTAYALGRLLGLDWLVGPLASVALIGATSWTAGALFGSGVGLVVLGFGVLSPFVLFQAGSYLSHPIAGGLLAGALAAFVAAERGSEVVQTDPSPPGLAGSRGSLRPLAWYAAAGGLLGAGFLVREAASVLFAVPLVARMLSERRWRGLACLIGGGLPFLLIYFAYNAALTSSPLLLPRSIFDPTDRFGFGDGLGFHHRHTLAAGLANTDELLTLLQFDLFGWPPLFSLGLIGLPFLLGRARAWDVLAAGGFLAFVVAYAAYFYHGVALGPRYYYEGLPWLLLLAGRGTQVLVELARSRLAVSTILGLLSLNTLLFYLPAELSRRTDFSALPDGRRVEVAFVQTSLLGPRLVGVESPSLVLTDDWWLYNAVLAPLNCPRLPDCPVLFGLAPTPDDARALRATYPGRMPLRVVDRAGRLELEPQPEAP